MYNIGIDIHKTKCVAAIKQKIRDKPVTLIFRMLELVCIPVQARLFGVHVCGQRNLSSERRAYRMSCTEFSNLGIFTV